MENQINPDEKNGEKSKPEASEILFGAELDREIAEAGGKIQLPEDGRVGVTMFDAGGSKDNLVTVIVPKKDLARIPSQSLVRIGSAKKEDGGDGREYQGIVVQGPFYEPDGLRADASIIVTTASHGVTFMPKYHGRVMVEIMGEIINNTTVPQRFRPLPNSPVFPLSPDEAKEALNLGGDIVIGSAIGHKDMEIRVPSQNKDVLPRHLGILGTTGGGKSTTVSGLIQKLQIAGVATILVDTEGEYTYIGHPTEDPKMINALKQRGLEPAGVKNTKILTLVGRDSTNPDHGNHQEFTLHFNHLSPYAVTEILDFTEAQQQRYLRTHDIARVALRDCGIFPSNANREKDEALLYELDELETGFPSLTLAMMYDLVSLCGKKVEQKKLPDDLSEINWYLRAPEFKPHEKKLIQLINRQEDLPSNVFSWRAIQGHLGQLLRLKIFDNPEAKPFDFDDLTKPGGVFIIDLNDTDSPKIRNLVIAELLKGLMDKQNEHYGTANTSTDRQRVMVIVEEAHEFLSSQRIKQMPTLYDQVARIAKRGRKRWLGMTFVTQLPQHLPDEVLALINNFILHKISDSSVVSRLKRTVAGVDDSTWDKLSNLSSGQAIVSLTHMRRAMLTAIDPTPSKLLMID